MYKCNIHTHTNKCQLSMCYLKKIYINIVFFPETLSMSKSFWKEEKY